MRLGNAHRLPILSDCLPTLPTLCDCPPSAYPVRLSHTPACEGGDGRRLGAEQAMRDVLKRAEPRLSPQRWGRGRRTEPRLHGPRLQVPLLHGPRLQVARRQVPRLQVPRLPAKTQPSMLRRLELTPRGPCFQWQGSCGAVQALENRCLEMSRGSCGAVEARPTRATDERAFVGRASLGKVAFKGVTRLGPPLGGGGGGPA